MKIREIVESIQRLPDGGVVNDRTRYDYGYLQSTAVVFSRRLLKLNYQKNRRINPVCYQKYFPVYEPDLQDDKCCVKFRHPEVITFDDQSDGLRYGGALSFAKNYPRIKSRAFLSTINDNPVTAANNGRRPTLLYDGNAQIIEIYGLPLIREVMTECIFNNPFDVPTYNEEFDEFPLNNDLIPDLMQMILQEQTSIESAKPLGPKDLPMQPIRRR